MGIKWAWYRYARGKPTIEGRRLDAPAPPLRADIPEGYSGGFQPMYLIFPTAGCWEVTGRVGGASLTFVTLVVKVGEGPGLAAPHGALRLAGTVGLWIDTEDIADTPSPSS
ncbi:MAG TPA: hypothetical protein VGW38_16290 [Chloroflexota bacterium]|nr:hypothetical protein [Chloroflexota bacterium]